MHTSHLPIAVVFLLAAFFIPSATLWAQQPTMTMVQQSTSCGASQTTVCITMNDMANVNGITHQLQWDNTVLSYNSHSVNTATYSELGAASALVPTGSTSTFNFVWTGISPVNPSGFVNGDVLYCITFDIIGTIGTGGTLVQQFPEANRPALPPANNLIINGTTRLEENDYIFNNVNVMATSGSGTDTTMPSVTGCPSDITVNAASGATSANVTWTPPSATDNCGMVTTASTANSGDSFTLSGSPHTVTYTFTDGSGNVNTCSFMVTVNNGGGTPSTGPGFVFSQGAFNCDDGQVELCIQANDLMGVSYMAHVIHWDDTVLQFNSTSNATTTGTPGFQSNTTNTLNFTFFSSNPSGADFTNGEIVYCVVFDIIGDISGGVVITQYDTADGRPPGFMGPENEILFVNGTTSTTYTFDDITLTPTGGTGIIDNTPPTFTACPTDITVAAAFGATTAPATWASPVAMDACGGVTTMSSNNSGDSFSVSGSPHTVTYTFTDDAGNISTCNFTVTVTPNGTPTTPGLNIQANDIACGDQTLEICITTTDIDDISYIGHVLIWDDTILSYVSTTNATNMGGSIAFQDNTSATLNASYFSSQPGGQDFMNGDVLYCVQFNVIGDATGGVTIGQYEDSDRPPGFPGPVNDIVANGMSINYTFTSTTVTAIDQQPPIWLNVPTNIQDTITTGACDLSVSWVEPIATDDCGVTMTSSSHMSGDVFPVGTTDVTYTATDGVGNTTTEMFSVTVIDTVPPTLSDCPMDTTIIVSGMVTDTMYTWTAPTAMDNCTGAMITSTHNPGDSFPLGTTTVTYTVTDASGNIVTCSFDVIVVNTLNITCPSDVTVSNDMGQCSALINGLGVTVVDPNGVATITYFTTGATILSGDNDISGASFNVGTTIVTYIVTDTDGNRVSCTFNVVVNDGEAPTLICSPDLTIQIPMSDMNTVVTGIGIVTNDNCPISGLMTTYILSGATTGSGTDDASGTSFNVGTTTVTYTVSDGTNTVNCSFDVTVEQSQLMIECPADLTVSTLTTSCSAQITNVNINVVSGTATTITYSTTGATILNSSNTGLNNVSLQIFNVGTTTVTYTVSDADGNTQMCNFDVTVQDNSIPIIECRADTTITIASGASDITVNNLDIISVMDNCTNNSDLVQSYMLTGATTGMGMGNVTGQLFGLGVTTVIYTVVDAANNAASCSFDVIVRTPNISLECPNDTSAVAAVGLCNAVVGDIFPTVLPSLDSAMQVLYTTTGSTGLNSPSTGINDISGSTFNTGSTTVTYTVVSTQNDTLVCEFNVSVLDTFPPTFQCPMDVVIQSTNMDTTAVVNGIDLQGPMDCDPTTSVNYTLSGATNSTGLDDASGTTFNGDTTTVTYFVTDGIGNRDSCSFLVIVEAAPISLQCPLDVSATVTSDSCTSTVSGIGIQVSDAGALASVTYTGTGATSFVSDTIGINDASNEVFNAGITMISYTVTDTLGNTATCSFNVEVEDESALFVICPDNVTVFLPADSSQSNAVVNGINLVDFGYNCITDNSIVVSYIIDNTIMGDDDASGNTFELGPTGVSYFVADTTGVVLNCNFTVNVVQRSPLDFTCPNDMTLQTDVDICGAVVTDTGFSIVDEGVLDTVIYILSGAVSDTLVSDTLVDLSNNTIPFPIGTTTVSYILVDTLGYSAQCSFDVNVEDGQAPTLECPSDINVIAIEGDTAVVINNIGLLDFKDNCDTSTSLEVTFELTGATTVSDTLNASGQSFNIGRTTVTYTVTDSSGNSASCSFVVDVSASDDLAIDCPEDMTVSATSFSCSATVGGISVDVLSSDSLTQSIVYGIRGATVIDSPPTGINNASGEVFNVGQSTVTYIVTDTLGRVETCSFIITVEDTSGPTVQCPQDLVLNIPLTDSTSIVNNIALVVGDDNCDPNPATTYEITGVTTTSGTDDASGTTFNLGISTVTYTITDDQGLSSTCSFTVEVGQFGLILECPSNVTIQADSTECGAVADSIAINVSPIGSLASLSYTLSGATVFQSPTDSIYYADSTVFNIGTTTVSYTAVDLVGETETCSFTVTVEDTLAPIFMNCPADIEIGMDTQECFATVRWTVPEVFESCDFIMVPNILPGTEIELQLPATDTMITYTATDVNGNVSTCSFRIIVRDDQLPNYIFCPETAEDYTVVQSDTICGAVVTWGEPQNFDNCGIASSMQTHTPGDVFPYGTTTVTYMAFDLSGNAGQCEFDVVVTDSIPISLMDCPMDTTITLMEGDSMTVVDWLEPTALGACEFTLTSNFMPGDTFSIGTTEVIYIATDTLAMNSDTCNFFITIETEVPVEIDTIPPVFENCPEDLIVGVDDGECTAVVIWTVPTATDNIGVDSLFASHMLGDVFNLGTTEVFYIAIDSTGNRDTCSFNITVEGPQNSVLICPGDVTVIAPTGVCGSVVDWTPPTVDRPCSDNPVSINSNFTPGTLFPVGTTEVIYIATDNAEYGDTCSFMITVLDQELPVFSDCPDNMIVSVEPGSCEANVNWTVPTASDNCGIADLSASHEPPFAFPIGETTVNYTAVDISGNANNCQFIITVIDDSAPVFDACPEPITVRADGTIVSDPSGIITDINSANCSNVQLSFLAPTASDACSTLEVIQTSGATSGSTFEPGTSVLIFEATDESDNTTVCELTIIVEGVGTGSVDITVDNPIVCEGGDVQLVGADLNIPDATYAWTVPGSAAAVTGATLDIFGITAEQAGTYTLTVTTSSGCTFTNSVDVEVQANPTLSVSYNDEDVLCGGGNVDLVFNAATIDDVVSWSWTGPNNFGPADQNPVITNATASDSGNYTVTATTAAGCTSTATVEVLIREQPALPTLSITGGSGLSQDDPSLIIGCGGDTFNLVGAEYEGDVQYLWSVTPDNIGFDPGNMSIAQAILTEAGDYIFEYAVLVDGCASDTVRMTVNIEAQPTIQTNIEGATACVNVDSTIVLQAIGDGVVSWEWFNPDGSSLATTQEVMLDNLTAELNGTYNVMGITANGCTAETTLDLVLSDQLASPTVADLGFVCEGEDMIIELGGTYPTDVEFQWQSDSIELAFTTNESTFDATNLPPGQYTATVTAVAPNGCVSESTELSFTILARPAIDLSAIAPTYDCISQDTMIQFVDNGEGGSKWFWFSSNDFTASEQNPTRLLTFGETPMTDTIYVQVTGENGCMSMDSTIVTFNQGVARPEIVGAARYCMGEEITLRLRDELPDSTIYEWIGPNGFGSVEPIIGIPGATTAQDGVFTVRATVGECVSEVSDSFTVTIITPPVLEVDNYTVFIGQSDTLDITNNDDLVDNLTISLGLLDPPFEGTVTLQGGVVNYTAPDRVTSDNFVYEICYDVCDDPNLLLCDDTRVTIDVKYPPEQCVITTLVTPNDDGNNDNLIVTCAQEGVYPDHELIIFNRWGDEIYRAAPYNNDWSGTYNGTPLPDGTYFYIFTTAPGAEAQKGFITLYR